MADDTRFSKGLVGGYGDLRAERSRMPALEHGTILDPYRHPEHLDEGRAFFAESVVEVEIGFGRCHFLKDRVRQAPERRFLGFEIRRSWCARMARFLEREGLDNTRVVWSDARPLLEELLPAAGVRAFYVFFPDPWWKKKHHKRRLLSEDTLEVIHGLLEPEGTLHLRTDVSDYLERVRELVGTHAGFEPAPAGVTREGEALPLTHREKKCAELEVPTYRACWRKVPRS